MAKGEVLKEFLVKLGYDVDQASESRFVGAIESATKAAAAMGAAVAALATGVAYASARIAAGLEEVHYQAQRTQASIQSIKSLAYAVSQLGGTYEGALSTIENFGAKMRQNPGYESLVRQLGVVTRHNGKLRDTGELLREVAVSLQSKPYPVAWKYAETLGLDERTFNALRSGEMGRYLEEYRRKTQAMGVDQGLAAERSVAFQRALRSLQETLGVLGEKMAQELLPGLTEFIKRIDKFVMEHADGIVEFFRKLGAAAQWVAEKFSALVDFFRPLAQGFDEVARSLTGQGGLAVALEALAALLATSILIKFARLIGLVADLRLGIAGLIAAGAIGHGFMTPEEAAKDPEQQKFNDAAKASSGRWRNWWKNTMPGFMGGDKMKGDPASGQGAENPNKLRSSAQESYDFWRSKGLDHAKALGMVANEQAESKFNPAARGDGGMAHGLYQHHPDRRAAILEGTGIDISTATAAKQREATHWELTKGNERAAWRALQNASTPGEAAAIISKMFERPANRDGEALSRAQIANGWGGKLRWAGDTPEVAASPQPDSPSPDGGASTPWWRRAFGGGASASPVGKSQRSMRDPEGDSEYQRWLSDPNSYRIQGSRVGQTGMGRFGFSGGGVSRLPSGMEAFEKSRLYVPPLAPASGNGDTEVNLQQRTEIHVMGGTDPSATAAAVGDLQRSVNEGLGRNIQGAVR